MRIAVVGAGLYGCVTAVELARAGHDVTLMDDQERIMHGASRANQGRIHRGFHYPRSDATTKEALAVAPLFEERYREALNPWPDHYYAVATQGSKTDAHAYRQHLLTHLLAHEEVPTSLVKNADLVVRSLDEKFVDLNELRSLMYAELHEARVTVDLGCHMNTTERLPGFDQTVWATYGRGQARQLQWEVVEVVVVKLPDQFRHLSLVVMDGDFCSIDPLPSGGVHSLHMLYDVRWSVRSTNRGSEPEIPLELQNLVDTGPVATARSARHQILRSVVRFLPTAAEAEYMYSMFTLRAVLPYFGGGDDRPWSVGRYANGIRVLPGKLASCLSAAQHVVGLVKVDAGHHIQEVVT